MVPSSLLEESSSHKPAKLDKTLATVSGGADYSISAPSAATLTIEGNTVSKPALTLQPAGPILSWNSTSGSVYRVAYKNNLSDPAWIPLGSDITATGSTTSLTDTSKQPQRFYLIMQVQ